MATRTATRTVTENDIRLQIFNSFMNCPHRDTDAIRKIHEQMREKDPLFFAHLAAWYRSQPNTIRDHNELFSALLITDPYIENRETGLALFREHALFMKNRILGFIKGKTVNIRVKTGETFKKGRKSIEKTKSVPKKVGLFKSIPTCLKTEIQSYLHWLEAHPERFDAVAMRNFNDLKSLYFARGKHGFKHSARAQKILFEKVYPENSKLTVFEKITKAEKPEIAAKLIVENKIPYTVAVGLVDKITPSILVALINAMSSQEVINNIASLKEKGAFDNPDTRALIDAKLEKAKKASNVSALKSKTAVATGRIQDEEIIKKLDGVADAQVKKSGTINIPTALFVDRSGSMSEAIEVGKRVAALISGVAEDEFHVVAFDNASMEIKAQGKTLSDWERAFKPVRPGGNTSIGCALRYLRLIGAKMEQIVVVTDEGENCNPFFHMEYASYAKEMGVSPQVVVIHVGSPGTTFREFLAQAKIPFDVYTPDGNDYYGLPGLVALLSRKSKLDLIMEIMATPLPKRRDFR